MSFFRRTAQRIVISSDKQDTLELFVTQLKTQRINGLKISSAQHLDDEWRCVINCESADTKYYQVILPLLNTSNGYQLFRITLELDDKSEPARHCPRELLVSFALKSQQAYGDDNEHEFTQKLTANITQGSYVDPATVGYYIIGGGSVTMSIPCLDIEKMESSIKSELERYDIKKYVMNVIEREVA